MSLICLHLHFNDAKTCVLLPSRSLSLARRRKWSQCIRLFRVLLISMPDDVELECGETIGPFRADRQVGFVEPPSSPIVYLAMKDMTGEAYHFKLERTDITNRLFESESPLMANCVVLYSKSLIKILITRDIHYGECLNAVLVAQKEPNIRVQNSNELLFLPILINNQEDNIKVLGPSQTFVPVAISEKNFEDIRIPPIRVEHKWQSCLPDTLQIVSSEMRFQIPIVGDGVKRKSCSPIQSLEDEERPETENFDKKFSCTCGISFRNEKTFKAHQSFYCKNTSNGIVRIDGLKKKPLKCSQCDFRPSSSSQMAIHLRTAHQKNKTYTCAICGYRAFSTRGIGTHMKTHPDDGMLSIITNDL